MKYIPVKDNPGLYRDTKSHGIINVNDNEYRLFKARKDAEKNKQAKEQAQENRINTLESKISNMENMLTTILDILKNDRNA